MSDQLSLNINTEEQLLDQFRGSLLGAAIGDALGFITEFARSKEDVQKAIGVDKVSQFSSWQRYTKHYTSGKSYTLQLPLPEGTYSDDTQLTLATARSIEADGTFNPESFANLELPVWLEYQLGGGSGTKAAARNLLKEEISWNNNFYITNYSSYTRSGGNGAAMRILPIALVNLHDRNKRYLEIWRSTVSTHGHPRGLMGAFLFSDAIVSLIKTPKNKLTWLDGLLEVCSQEYPLILEQWSEEEEEFSEWLNKWNKENRDNLDFTTAWKSCCKETLHYLTLIRDRHSRPKIDASLEDLGCFKKKTKGSGNGTVSAAILFFYHFFNLTETTEKHFTEAVMPVINKLGIDTDTIAYFVGGMVGAYSGFKTIPRFFVDRLQDSEYLLSLADRCFKIQSQSIKKEEVLDFNYPETSTRHSLTTKDLFSVDVAVNSKIIMPILGNGVVLSKKDLTPAWKYKHVYFFQVKLDLGQSIFLKTERKLTSEEEETIQSKKNERISCSPKPSAYEPNSRHSESNKIVGKQQQMHLTKKEVSLSVYLDELKARVEREDFSSHSIIEVLREIKFKAQNKALYDAYFSWLWAALPETLSENDNAEHTKQEIINNLNEQS